MRREVEDWLKRLGVDVVEEVYAPARKDALETVEAEFKARFAGAWDLLGTDLRLKVDVDVEDFLYQIEKGREEYDSIAEEELPKRLTEAELKKLTKKELIETILERETELWEEYQASGTIFAERASEAYEGADEVLHGIPDAITDCLENFKRELGL
jgi:hypothetical protein